MDEQWIRESAWAKLPPSPPDAPTLSVVYDESLGCIAAITEADGTIHIGVDPAP